MCVSAVRANIRHPVGRVQQAGGRNGEMRGPPPMHSASGRNPRNMARWSGNAPRRPQTAPQVSASTPRQVREPQDDGRLIVRFQAASWMEIAWHLYQWGDKVEVLAPKALRDLVEGYRHSDFVAMQ